MKKIILYCILISTFACNNKQSYKNSDLDLDKRVHLLLDEMTLDEKVSQLCSSMNDQTNLNSPVRSKSDSARNLFKNGTGFIFMGVQGNDAELFVKNLNDIQRYFVENTRLGIPVLFGAEGLHGFVAHGATIFPQNIALGGTFDRELIERIYTVAAREMRAWGITQVFAPNLDLGREPRFGRVEETYSEDPYLTSQIGFAAVRGFQGRDLKDLKDHHVIATLKHFAGHGEPMGGRNTGPIGNVNTIYFHENPLYPFETAIKEGGALSVMASYNDADGVPNHCNKTLLTDILVDQFGFGGYVISDLNGVTRIIEEQKAAKGYKEAALMSFNAGIDMDLVRGKCSFMKIKELVQEGKISKERLNQAVERILRLKFLLGLFENPYVNAKNVVKLTNTTEDRALNLKAAEEAAVLLKNENILPFNETKIKNLAVIGPMSGSIHLGGYSYEPFQGVSILSGLQQFGKGKFKVYYAEGCKINQKPATFWTDGDVVINSKADDLKLIAEAVKAAKSSDAIVLTIGENESYSREAWSENHLGDRESLDLPGRQNELVDALVKTGKPIVAVMVGGRPLSYNYVAEKVPAIIQAWYLGQETGTAMANLLFGKINPSGKLSITIPRSVGQLPCYYSQLTSQVRSYLGANNSPLYPFGYGLSYTTFGYSNPELSKSEIIPGESTVLKVLVKNTGLVAGSEVVQLYIRDEISSVVRPVIQLKDFIRIYLKPGETHIVKFTIDNSKLSFFNQELKRIVEPGTFELKIGGNSKDLKSIKLTLK